MGKNPATIPAHIRSTSTRANHFSVEPLEDRTFFAWGAFPNLIDLDAAASKYPTVNGKGVAIADLDTGINFNHWALKGRIWTNPGEIAGNGRDDDKNGYVDDLHGWDFVGKDNSPNDDQGHGTMTGGIMVANRFTNNGTPSRGYYGDGAQYQGIASGATVIPLRVIDKSNVMDPRRVEAALKWVLANHARYSIASVNMSLSVGKANYWIVADEIKSLHDRGVFIAASAGNGSSTSNTLVYPAAGPNVAAVGALNSNDTLNTITSRGPRLDILAPGNQVPYLTLSNQFLAGGAATSPASPFIAAAGAVLMALRPGITPDQILSVLKDSGKSVYDPTTRLSFKRLDMDNAIALTMSRYGARPAPLPTPTFSTTTIQAESSSQTSTLLKSSTGLGYITSGSWARYSNVNFGTDGNARTFTLRYAVNVANAGGTLRIRTDSPTGQILGSLTLSSTGGWGTYTTKTITLAKTTGLKTLYLTFSGALPGLGNVDWFRIA